MNFLHHEGTGEEIKGLACGLLRTGVNTHMSEAALSEADNCVGNSWFIPATDIGCEK